MCVGVLCDSKMKSSCEGRLRGGRPSGLLASNSIVIESRVSKRQLYGSEDRGVNSSMPVFSSQKCENRYKMYKAQGKGKVPFPCISDLRISPKNLGNKHPFTSQCSANSLVLLEFSQDTMRQC